jgi:tetratricopeptide (TPR) repeat protein
MATVFLTVIGVGFVFAAGPGQEDLDKATEAKLGAETTADLDKVVQLLESALKKGLDEPSSRIAKQLLSATLFQRGSVTAATVAKGFSQNATWTKIRQDALADLQQAVKLDPKQSQAFLLIAQLNRLPGGNLKQAREAIDQAMKIDEEDPAVRVKLLILRASFPEKPEKRLADLDEAVRLEPGDVAARYDRGLLLADLGKLDAALADLNQAIVLDSDDTRLYEEKAIVLARLKRFDESLAALDKAKQLKPDSISLLVEKANVHSQQQKPEAAMEDLNQALKIEPKNVVLLLLRAGLFQEKGEKDKALADVDQALKLKPNLPLAIRTRALLLAQDERYEEATQVLEKLHDAAPKDVRTLIDLTSLYGVQRQFDKAIHFYNLWIAAQPDDWRAFRGRADAYLNLGKQAEAIADYEKAIKLEPKEEGVLNNLAWVLATSPDAKLRDGKRAIHLATQACELSDYKLAYILSTLAAAYAESGDFQKAIQWSSKAVEIGDKEHDNSLKKELESYKAGKPWRELQPETPPLKKTPAKPEAKPAAKPGEKPAAKPEAKPAAKP